MDIVIIGTEFYSLYMAWYLSAKNKVILVNNGCFGGAFANETYGGFFIHKNEYILNMFKALELDYRLRQLIEVGYIGNEIVKLNNVPINLVNEYYNRISNNFTGGKCVHSFLERIKEIFIFNKYEFFGKLFIALFNNPNFTYIDSKYQIDYANKKIKVNDILYSYDKLLFTTSLVDFLNSKNEKYNYYTEEYIGNYAVIEKILIDSKDITWDVCYNYVENEHLDIKRLIKKNDNCITIEYFKYKDDAKATRIKKEMIDNIIGNNSFDSTKIISTNRLPGYIRKNDFYETQIKELDLGNIYLFGRFCTLNSNELTNDTIVDFHKRFLNDD